MLVVPAALFLPTEPANDELRFYERAMRALATSGVPFMVGGMYALLHYAGISRTTKDLDIFIEKRHVDSALLALEEAGFETEIACPHWLGKAHDAAHFVDIIWSSGNGVAVVDEEWIERAEHATLLGVPVLVCPVEETIWSKAFVQERERYDGADVLHLLRAQAKSIHWQHLVERFGDHHRVLLAHLILFGYVYPDAKDAVPSWVMRTLVSRLHDEPFDEATCGGTFLSREQYLVDISRGYRDARLPPTGVMTQREIDAWTPPPGRRHE